MDTNTTTAATEASIVNQVIAKVKSGAYDIQVSEEGSTKTFTLKDNVHVILEQSGERQMKYLEISGKRLSGSEVRKLAHAVERAMNPSTHSRKKVELDESAVADLMNLI